MVCVDLRAEHQTSGVVCSPSTRDVAASADDPLRRAAVVKKKTAPKRAGRKQSIEARAIKALELIGNDGQRLANLVVVIEEMLAQQRASSRTKK